jgi:hypothetical protein
MSPGPSKPWVRTDSQAAASSSRPQTADTSRQRLHTVPRRKHRRAETGLNTTPSSKPRPRDGSLHSSDRRLRTDGSQPHAGPQPAWRRAPSRRSALPHSLRRSRSQKLRHLFLPLRAPREEKEERPPPARPRSTMSRTLYSSDPYLPFGIPHTPPCKPAPGRGRQSRWQFQYTGFAHPAE